MVQFPISPPYGRRVEDDGRIWVWDEEKWTWPELLDDEWPEDVPGQQLRSFYIAADGSDASPGTKAQPWATVARVNAEPKEPGDAFMFRAGDTLQGRGLESTTSGTPDHPIFFRSYGSRHQRATIRPGFGSGPAGSTWGTGGIWASNTESGFSLLNAGHNRVENLIIIGTDSRDLNNWGVKLEANSPDLVKYPGNVLSNLDVSNCGRIGILITTPIHGSEAASANPGFADLLVEDCYVHHNRDGMHLFRLSGSVGSNLPVANCNRNVTIRRCVFAYNHGAGGIPAQQVGAGIPGNGLCVRTIESGGLVEYCVAYENGRETPHEIGGPLGLWMANTNDTIFRFCESYNNHDAPTGADGGGLDIDGGCTNSGFEYCYSHDNQGSGLQYGNFAGGGITDNNWFRFCISENDAIRSAANTIALFNHDPSVPGVCTYHNCVVYQSRSRPMATHMSVTGQPVVVNFYNCIFIFAGVSNEFVTVPANGMSRWRFVGNNWSGTGCWWNWGGTIYNTLETWRGASNQPERWLGIDRGRAGDHGLDGAGNGGTLALPGSGPVSQAMFAAWQRYRLLPGSANRYAGLNTLELFGVDPGPHDLFGSPITPTTLSIGAHSPGA